jgi:hypothetical protein
MKQSKKQVYYIKKNNGNLGWVYECGGKIRQATNKRIMGGNIVGEALKGQPDNVKLTLIFEILPDNKDMEDKHE